MEGKYKTILKEEITMNVIVKHVVEIAGGLVLGGLASDAVNGLGKLAKKAVVKAQAKVKKPKN
jgi:hypothetical protein